MIDIAATFEKYESEFLKFDLVENKTSYRPDLHAFILLDRLVPGKSDIVCSAEHDEIWLNVNMDYLANSATEEEILELIRCGIRFDKETDSLAMFV